MKMEQTGCSETSAYKIQTPGNYPEENIQHTEHGESLKSRIQYTYYQNTHTLQNPHKHTHNKTHTYTHTHTHNKTHTYTHTHTHYKTI